ncbi:hypothetical protein HDV05_003895 [Chytridiales sp. JEL 0842]|nr:hypothetical protein HDV05_003895 [Chytridiales sp. JEL 0842]
MTRTWAEYIWGTTSAKPTEHDQSGNSSESSQGSTTGPSKSSRFDPSIIPDVHDKVWENPYYPLSGPPQSQEERDYLKAIINDELNATRAGIRKAFGPKDGDKVAVSNCADLRYEMARCMTSFGWKGLCMKEKKAFDECIEIQKDKLKEVGYYSLNHDASDRERAILADRADRLYLAEMARRKLEEKPATM